MTFQIGNKYALGYKHTDEAKKKIIKALTGRKCSKKTRKKIGLANSISLKGRKLSDSCRKKLSETHKKLNSVQRLLNYVKKNGVWNKGKKLSKAFREKNSEAHKGIQSDEKHPNWKGDKVGYEGLHAWIRRKLGKAKKCSKCGKEGTGREIHWANRDHKYRRNTDDFIEICAGCHTKYDKDNNLRRYYGFFQRPVQ